MGAIRRREQGVAWQGGGKGHSKCTVAQCAPACADTSGWSTVVADGSFLLFFFFKVHFPVTTALLLCLFLTFA